MLAYHDMQLSAATPADAALVRALQADLRALGYLKRGIDGVFGASTTLAVRRLQYDLLHNHGRSTGHDGSAPLKMTDFAGGVTEVTGVVDSALASAIEALLNAAAFMKLPTHTDPAAANQAALAAVKAQAGKPAPIPFLLAIFQQESRCEHFAVALSAADQDNYVTVGLDTATTEDCVTSRGYGIGQYTLFHSSPASSDGAAPISTRPSTSF
jgi:peptidoglycan hydrolase-like protein with peptidoglycan-binding domain